MKLMNLATSLLVLTSVTIAKAETPKSENNIVDYNCRIVQYESKESKQFTPATETPIHVGITQPQSSVPASMVHTGEGLDQLTWKFTRANGLMQVEVQDSLGGVIFITSVLDGDTIGIEIPMTKNILNCQIPKVMKLLKIDPTAYGEHIRKLKIDPTKYGTEMIIHRSFDNDALRRLVDKYMEAEKR